MRPGQGLHSPAAPPRWRGILIAGEQGLAVTTTRHWAVRRRHPAPGGLVVWLERMNQILEIDTANHVAVDPAGRHPGCAGRHVPPAAAWSTR